MSGSENWIKLYRWWQEHWKLHSNDYLIDGQSPLISTYPRRSSQIIKIKKRPSCATIESSQLTHNDFRYVRDSIRRKNPLTTRIIPTQLAAKKRHQFRKSTTCDISSDDIRPNENKYLSSMNKKRQSGTRRFSLVKFELTSNDSNRTKDEQKYPNSNLFQKIFCRQYSPKTRPYPSDYSDDNTTFPLTLDDNCRRMSHIFNPKATSTSRQIDEIIAPTNLDSYLSKRRNTTGSISINKIIDLKNLSNTNNNPKLSNEKIDIFQTVEDSDFLLTKQLIKSNENLINSYNEYDWCPLDIAVMLNNIPMIRLLLHYGANESSKIQPEEVRYKSVCQQLEQNLDDIQQSRRLSPSCDKQQRHRQTKSQQQEQLNQQRSLTLSQMKDNYEHAGVPDAPTNVRLMVTGSDNITVTFDEPLRSNGAMVTKYRIEWSCDESFTNLCSDIIKNCFLREYIIRNLSVGQKCYVRVSAGNLKGFGQTVLANPPYCVPSNWREFSKTSRTNVCDLRFEDILHKIWNEKDGMSTSRSIDGNESPETTNAKHRRRSYGNLRKNLRQLFQQYPRLSRSMKRGLYLVSIMLNGDRILVTNEDVLPMVEVDENYGHNLLADFQWFMKLTFVWDDLKALRPDLERCASVTSFYLRIKLVQAAIELQTLEEINNLGRLHHTFFRDQDGNTAFLLINDLSSEIRLNLCPPNLKWIPISKYLELIKDSPSNTNNSCLQQITDNLKDMIEFYHASMCRLDSGLYVAYLKIQNSVDSIRVMVNKSMPGSLPCTKIRSISNVSREEWEWLHKHNQDDLIEENLEVFKNQFHSAAKELFVMLDLPETHFSNSRVYDSQVVEIREDLSLIILMSTADEVNNLSTSSSHFLSPFIYLPVYIFEVLQHLSNNYRFICQYSRVSICLDFELICAQQSQREAFSMIELDESRYRLKHLLSCQQDLDDIWRLSRWLVHVINCAKDKTYVGISLKSFQTHSRRQTSSIEKSDSGFIDLEENSVELTFYLSLLTTNTYIPLKIRLNKTTKLNQILEIILNEHQDSFQLNRSLLNFIWIPTNGREYCLEEHLTANDLQKRLQRFGGQIHLRSKNLSLLHSLQESFESQMNCSVDI